MRGEKKQDRFKRVAQKRVQNVLESIRRLSQCSNKRMYDWQEQDLNKIWGAIDKELKSCKSSYENSEMEEFKL